MSLLNICSGWDYGDVSGNEIRSGALWCQMSLCISPLRCSTAYKPTRLSGDNAHTPVTYADFQNSWRSEKNTLSSNAVKPLLSLEISPSNQSTDSPNSTPPSSSAIS